jgi:hypothetical protein
MKKGSQRLISLLIIIFILLSFSSCYGYVPFKIPFKIPKVLQGSGNVITESRSVKDFNRVSMTWFGELNITQGEEESLIVKAEDNIMKYIFTEVREDTLYLGFDTKKYKIILPSKPIEYNLRLKELVDLDIAGSAIIDSESIESDYLDVKLSGSAKVNIDSLKGKKLDINVSGSGKIELAGEVNEQNIKISGSGNYNAKDLHSENVNLKVSGSGKANIWATESLDVNISGSGNVNYYGNPTVRSSISGSGKINNLGNR